MQKIAENIITYKIYLINATLDGVNIDLKWLALNVPVLSQNKL